jgi:hypothetical protein
METSYSPNACTAAASASTDAEVMSTFLMITSTCEEMGLSGSDSGSTDGSGNGSDNGSSDDGMNGSGNGSDNGSSGDDSFCAYCCCDDDLHGSFACDDACDMCDAYPASSCADNGSW